MITLNNWHLFFIIVLPLIVGFILGSFFASYLFKKQVKKFQEELGTADKEQLKNMFSAFGRKPSEQQLNKIVSSVKKKIVKKSK